MIAKEIRYTKDIIVSKINKKPILYDSSLWSVDYIDMHSTGATISKNGLDEMIINIQDLIDEGHMIETHLENQYIFDNYEHAIQVCKKFNAELFL